MSRSRNKGTAFETAVVRFLIEEGFTRVERRALAGTADKGDIAGLPGFAVEVKNCQRDGLPGWVDEVETERAHAGADYGVVWHHRRGRAHPRDGFVTMTGATFARLVRALEGGPNVG